MLPRNNDNRRADGATIQEFSIEIPDKDADTIHSGTWYPFLPSFTKMLTELPTSVDKAVEYILSQPDAN